MKCISVHQPWATLMVHGLTSCDVRTWQTAHRGPLAIHASRKCADEEIALCRRSPVRELLEQLGYGSPYELSRGGVLGVVELVHCEPWSPVKRDEPKDALAGCDPRVGRYRWRLARPRLLPRPLLLGLKQANPVSL